MMSPKGVDLFCSTYFSSFPETCRKSSVNYEVDVNSTNGGIIAEDRSQLNQQYSYKCLRALRRTAVNSTNSGITEEDVSQLTNSNSIIAEDLSQLNQQ
ncbi:hypothetical protein E3N88_29752 [Mikania micrantha]|uniref:Uncharacterized protein n=1 Tax=Mikania micrantha TaxID=192012 RepID=A0A5N6MKM9_9ASTR|nr:hypothetical protein E3N88_29752 [Mikania micrantha]